MRALYRGCILQAAITEARGTNLMLVDGELVDQGGAISRFDRLLISVTELEPIEFNSELEEQLYQEATSYSETTLETERISRAKRWLVRFKRPDLPKTAKNPSFQAYGYDPFTGQHLHELIEVDEDYVITRGVNQPSSLKLVYEVRGRRFTKTLQIISIEEVEA
jgi:hypothetical protein